MTEGPRLSRPGDLRRLFILGVVVRQVADVLRGLAFDSDCPRRQPPFSAVTRSAHPHKSPLQDRFTQGNANGAEPPRDGADSG